MTEYPREFDIPVPWGKISAKWWGPESKEPIVFLHGWQDNLGSFDRLIPLLPKGLPYLTFDLPGHGFSSPYPKGVYYYIFWDGIVLLRRLVRQMGWTKISIVGHSLGAGIGFLYAASFPDNVDKLVCFDMACPRVSKPSTSLQYTTDCVEKFLHYDDLIDEKEVCHKYDDMPKLVMEAYRGSITLRSAEILMRRGVKPSEKQPDKFVFTRDLRLKVASLAMMSLDVILEFASKIRCHYFNIKATKTIPMDFPEIYDQVLDQIKQNAKTFKFIEIEGTHHLHLNNPEDVAPQVSEFLVQPISSNGQS